MRIVIAGAGDVGKYLAKMFRSESHDIIIIDNNPQNLETLSSRFDIMTYEGNVTFMKDLHIARDSEHDRLHTGIEPRSEKDTRQSR